MNLNEASLFVGKSKDFFSMRRYCDPRFAGLNGDQCIKKFNEINEIKSNYQHILADIYYELADKRMLSRVSQYCEDRGVNEAKYVLCNFPFIEGRLMSEKYQHKVEQFLKYYEEFKNEAI